MYRLYYSPGACSLAAHIVLEEIGEPYELDLRLSRDSSGTENPDYAAINPKRRVPALAGVAGRSGGAENLLTELSAILIYLARTHPALGLLPSDPAAEARCVEWMNWLTGAVHAMSFGQIWRPQRFVAGARDYAAVTARGHETLREQFAYIEQLLADGRQWAVPDAYSVVDPYLLVIYLWGERLTLDMARLYPAWTRLTKKIMARPAVKRALAQEGLSPPAAIRP